MAKQTVNRFLGFTSMMAFLLTGFGPCASGQARMPESPQAIAAKLNIVIVEGEGAINNIKARTARAPIVQVEDENHRPVAGATVAFSLPARGAGGSFVHGGKIFKILSDANGRATAVIKPNHALGVFKINVSASLHGQQLATATVTQTNAIATTAAGSAAAGGATGSGTGGAGAGGTAGTSTATGAGAGTTGGATGGATGAAGAGGAGAAGAGAAGAGTAGAGAAGAGAAGVAVGVSATTIGVIAGGAAVAAGVAAKVATGGGSGDNTSTPPPPPPPPTGTIGAPGLPGFGPAAAIRTSSPFRSAGIAGLRTVGAAQLQPFARPNALIDKGIIVGSYGWRHTMPKLRGVTVKIPRLPAIGRLNLPLSGALFPARPGFVRLVALRAVRLAATHVSIAPPRVNNRVSPVRQGRSK